MPALRRPAIQAKGIHPAPWPDPDPSRGTVEHGSGDFARRAWHVPAELPDSGAELPFAARDGRFARMFRGSTFGLDRTADKRGPDSGSARTETSCKSRHRHMCIPDASNSRHLCLAFETMFGAPPGSRTMQSWLGRLSQPQARSARVASRRPVDMWTTQGRCPHTHRSSSNSQLQFDDLTKAVFTRSSHIRAIHVRSAVTSALPIPPTLCGS
jgi:hypothetical protein